MAIVDVRIDDRLIHGQVCGFWVPHNSVDKILVVDNQIVNDDIRKTALHFGCPEGVKLSILNAKTAADKLKRNLDQGSNVMILCNSPEPLLEMVKEGYVIKKITIGNMSNKKDTRSVKNTVFVSNKDIEDFKQLAQFGVKLMAQMVPNESPIDLLTLI